MDDRGGSNKHLGVDISAKGLKGIHGHQTVGWASVPIPNLGDSDKKQVSICLANFK